MGPGGRIGKDFVVIKAQVAWASAVKRGDVDYFLRPRRRARWHGANDHSDLVESETPGVPQEDGLGHRVVTPLGVAKDQNFVPPLKRNICVRSQTDTPDTLEQYFVIG
jgi:hypothetical protein